MGLASGARPGAAEACGAERLRLLHLGSFRRTPPEPTLPMPAAGAATTTLRRSGPGGVGRRDGARTGAASRGSIRGPPSVQELERRPGLPERPSGRPAHEDQPSRLLVVDAVRVAD